MTDAAPSLDELLAHAGWLEALARRLVGDASADDLVQEVWLQVARRPPYGVRSPRGWLASVLRSVNRRRLERAAARDDRERVTARAEALPSADELVGRAEAQRLLVTAVLELPTAERHAVLLYYFEGLSAAQIARRSDTPDSTVRQRIARGLERLRERLDARPGGRESWLRGVVLLAAVSGRDPGPPLASGSAPTPASNVPAPTAPSVVLSAALSSTAMTKFALLLVSAALLLWIASVSWPNDDAPPRTDLELAEDAEEVEGAVDADDARVLEPGADGTAWPILEQIGYMDMTDTELDARQSEPIPPAEARD